VVLEENTLRTPKQENVKLKVGGSYTVRLEISRSIEGFTFQPSKKTLPGLRLPFQNGKTLKLRMMHQAVKLKNESPLD
jgi:hypothetical protein